jgi:dTDP-4-amino-4,6-dideoxygalactose transaminase
MYTNSRMYLSFVADLIFSRAMGEAEKTRLEEEIRQRFDIAQAVAMPQARVAIYFALKALIRKGQSVILSPYTIADIINMVICAGGRPVFADIDRKTCNVDPAQIKRLIDKNTGAVMITHLHGLACPMDEIVAICKNAGVPLIEDAAQAFGAGYRGKKLGTFGDAGIYSFGRYKNLVAFYGGMLVTPHKEISQKVRSKINAYAPMEKSSIAKRVAGCLIKDIMTMTPMFPAIVYPFIRFCNLNNINFINRLVETELDLSRKNAFPGPYARKMSSLQAKTALKRIDKVESENSTRIRNAKIYHQGLKNIPEILLPPLKDDGSNIYSYFPIQYAERRALVKELLRTGRDVGVQHLKNCADLHAFKDFYSDCPKARATANEVVLLPTYPRYSEKEVYKTIDAVRSYFNDRVLAR